MSLNNIEILGYNSLANLSQINADEVNTDILTKSDPDISDAQFDTLFGISTAQTIQQQIDGVTGNISTLQGQVTTLQGQMTTANSNISTLQGQYTTLDGEVNTLQSEMNTAQSDINTLQSEMNTAQSDINTLQSEMNDAQADIGALYGLTSTNTAAIAGLVISQAAQDVTLAAHTASIAGLNGDVNDLEGRVGTLEVKTTDQSWGSLTGTTFATKVNVGGGSGVVLNTASASQFNSGILINSIQSPDPTTNINIGTQLTTGDINLGTVFIGPTMGIALNWGSTSNTGQLSLAGGSFNLLSSGIYTQRSGPTFGMTMGDTQSSGIMNIATRGDRAGIININTGTTSTAPINISSATNTNAPITIGSAASTTQTLALNGITTIAGTTNINTTTFSDTNIGNGASGGNFTVNAAVNTITGTTNTLTSTGETEINCVALDINATGATNLDTTGIAINATAAGIQTFATTSTLIQSTTSTTLTSGGETEINCVALDINATGAITIDSTSTFNLNSTTNTILGITDVNSTGTAVTKIGNVTGNTNITGITTFGNTYTAPTRTLQIGADLVNYTLTQNTGQAPVTGNVWTPTRVNIPANNCYDFIQFSIPFDLSVRKNGAGAVAPGDLTVTYNSITFTVSKNGVARTITTEFYDLVDFTAGGSRTWGTTAFGTADASYFWSYWGYFNFGIPIDTWNATADYYDVAITMNATASHVNGGTWDVRSLGLGQTVTTGATPFTQTRQWFASQAPIVPFYPVYVAPYVNSNNTALGGMTVASPNPLYVSNNGDATYYAQNSLLFKSGAGYWTAQSSSNYYYQSPTNSYSVIYGTQGGEQLLNYEFSPGGVVINSNTNTFNLTTDDSINLTANSGDVTINTQNCYIDTTNETTINSASVTITTTSNVNINNKNLLYSPPVFTTAATVNITFPLQSIYMITSTTASSRDYILPTATAAHAGAIFRLVNTVPTNTVDYTISIKTTGTQYLTLGNGDETLNLQTYQLQMDETSVEFVYNGSNYWLCLSQRPTVPTGTIISYPIAINTTRYGLQNRFVICDGASLNATANPRFFNLWKVIGTTFGGTGVTAFFTPNLQGTVLKGAGSKTVSQASNSNAGGTINVAHTATISAFQNDATLVIKQAGWYSNSGSGSQSRSRTRIPADGVESNPGQDTSTYVDRYAEEVRVYNMGVNWYIKL